MDKEPIIRIIAYVEAHLRDTLSIDEFAKAFGYSKFHFIRFFYKHTKFTPAEYIRKRRITEIVCRASDNKQPISDIAFQYGFNSKENFTRAFQKEHRILPTEWRNSGCSLHLFYPYSLNSDPEIPQVSLQYLDSFSLVAYPFEDLHPPLCWNRYNVEKRSLRLSGGETAEDFGAMIWDSKKGALKYYIGVRERDAKGNREGTVSLAIKGGLYAVFLTSPASKNTFVNRIRSTWEWIDRVWLLDHSYRRAQGYELESYVETSHHYRERIYIPIEKE